MSHQIEMFTMTTQQLHIKWAKARGRANAEIANHANNSNNLAK